MHYPYYQYYIYAGIRYIIPADLFLLSLDNEPLPLEGKWLSVRRSNGLSTTPLTCHSRSPRLLAPDL